MDHDPVKIFLVGKEAAGVGPLQGLRHARPVLDGGIKGLFRLGFGWVVGAFGFGIFVGRFGCGRRGGAGCRLGDTQVVEKDIALGVGQDEEGRLGRKGGFLTKGFQGSGLTDGSGQALFQGLHLAQSNSGHQEMVGPRIVSAPESGDALGQTFFRVIDHSGLDMAL